MTFVPDTAGQHEFFRSVHGPVAQNLGLLVDRMVIEAEGLAPVGPPPEDYPNRSTRWDGPPLYTTHERTRVYATADGVAARFGSKAPHAAAVHEGSRPHTIRARYAKRLRFRQAGAVVYRVQVNHPGHPQPNRWLVRAAARILGR